MAGTTTRAKFQGCTEHSGKLHVPQGTRLVKQNVQLPPSSGAAIGHVYHHAPTGQWFTVSRGSKPASWKVCTYVGATCPCGG